MKRHSEAIQYLFKNSGHFDSEIISRFTDIIKSKKCRALVPEPVLYKVIYIGDYLIPNKIEQKDIGTKKSEKFFVPVERFLKKEKKQVKKAENLETKLSLSEIRAGLITNEDVKTKFGRLVIQKGTLINSDHIDELKQLSSEGLLAGEIEVLVPRDMPGQE